jgi:hypothetical protein
MTKIPKPMLAESEVATRLPVKDLEGARRYCQLGVVGVRLGLFVADLIHQAHVASCQTRKELDRKRR